MILLKKTTLVSVLAGVLFLLHSQLTVTAGVSAKQAKTWKAGTHTLSLTVNNRVRRYLVHVPQSYASGYQWPVVIMFHGGGGKARAAMRQTGWAKKADSEGFLAVFPEGTPSDPSKTGHFARNPQSWNDGSGRRIAAVEKNAADIAFVSDLIDDLNDRFDINKNRVYITGFSNGASMAFRVARELSRSIAAVAPIAGSDWLEAKWPDRVVPLLYMTGTDDPLNPLKGGEISIGAKSFGTKPSILEMMNRWVDRYGFTEEPLVAYEKDGTKGISYQTKNGIDIVVLYTIKDHGHYWPGDRSVLPKSIAGKNSTPLNATDIIWDFFKRHSLADNH